MDWSQLGCLGDDETHEGFLHNDRQGLKIAYRITFVSFGSNNCLPLPLASSSFNTLHHQEGTKLQFLHYITSCRANIKRRVLFPVPAPRESWEAHL